MTIAVPYSWLKQVSREVLQKEKIPPFGFPPPFPWNEMANLFGPALQTNSVSFTPQAWHQLPGERLLYDFGQNPQVFAISLMPYPGVAWLIVADSELDRFISLVLTRQEDLAHVLDPAYRVGFCEFMALQFFNILRKLDYVKELTPHLLKDQLLPTNTPLYAQDLTFKCGQAAPFALRIIFSEELRHAFKEKYAERTVDSQISISLAEKLSLTLHLEAGYTTLTTTEWKKLQVGDFLLLEQCSLDPAKDKGRVMLTLDRRPLYRARLKEKQLKILEFPLYHEVESPMAPKNNSNDDFEEIFEQHHTENSNDDDFFSDASTHAEAAQDLPADVQESSELASQATQEGETVNVANLPLTVVIEVGRLQLSVRKLLEMQPGDTLELDIDPDSGVDLVVNNTVVGKGELLKIGESLGVRILDKV